MIPWLFFYTILVQGGRHYPAIYLRNNLIMNIIYPPNENSCLRHCAYSVITTIIILYCIIIIVITIVLMRIERTSCNSHSGLGDTIFFILSGGGRETTQKRRSRKIFTYRFMDPTILNPVSINLLYMLSYSTILCDYLSNPTLPFLGVTFLLFYRNVL